MKHFAPLSLILIALTCSVAAAQGVRVTEASRSTVDVYVGDATTPRQVVQTQRTVFEEQELGGSQTLRTYTSLQKDGEEQLARRVHVVIHGARGTASRYEPLTDVPQSVREHLEKDLEEDRFLPLLATIPAQDTGPWEISRELTSGLLDYRVDSLRPESKSAARLHTREAEGQERPGADFHFDLTLNRITQSGLQLDEGTRVVADVRLERHAQGLVIGFRSQLEGRILAIHSQALPAGSRVVGDTRYRRTYEELRPTAETATRPLREVLKAYLGTPPLAEGLAGSLGSLGRF